MLPAAQRLRRTSDIQSVYKTGKVAYTSFFRVLAKTTQFTQSRATVIVSTRVSKKATERNRLKRRVRVVLRDLLTQTKGTHDIVIIAQPKAVAIDFSQLAAALTAGFKKLRLLWWYKQFHAAYNTSRLKQFVFIKPRFRRTMGGFPEWVFMDVVIGQAVPSIPIQQ